MSKEEMAKTIGKKAFYKVANGLKFEVTIKDAKMEYGNKRYLIVPVKGEGEKWVEGVEFNNK